MRPWAIAALTAEQLAAVVTALGGLIGGAAVLINALRGGDDDGDVAAATTVSVLTAIRREELELARSDRTRCAEEVASMQERLRTLTAEVNRLEGEVAQLQLEADRETT